MQISRRGEEETHSVTIADGQTTALFGVFGDLTEWLLPASLNLSTKVKIPRLDELYLSRSSAAPCSGQIGLRVARALVNNAGKLTVGMPADADVVGGSNAITFEGALPDEDPLKAFIGEYGYDPIPMLLPAMYGTQTVNSKRVTVLPYASIIVYGVAAGEIVTLRATGLSITVHGRGA